MKTIVIFCFSLCLIGISLASGQAVDHTLSLALELADENLHDLAALEFRRCSYSAADSEKKAGFLTAAAWEYMQIDDFKISNKMLDQAESFSRTATPPALLIRGEMELTRRRLTDSAFFFSTLSETPGTSISFKRTAFARLAVIDVLRDDLSSARNYLTRAESSKAIKELELYASKPRKSPRIGGLLGLIPGLGYAYSGEYANAARSLIINSIFIYAMVETAEEDQWAAFTALTFFELTWYTGSIYGGIDSAQRFNRRMMDGVTGSIRDEFQYELDLKQIPTINIEFKF